MLFSFALIGGTLYKWTHTEYIIQGFFLLTCFLRFSYIAVCNCRFTFLHCCEEYWIVWTSTLFFCPPAPAFGKQGEPQVQQIRVPFNASRIDPFLGKSPESGLGISKWFAFISGNTGCPHFRSPSGEWAGFNFSGGR